MSDTRISKAQNLARIRDNQRRSRARRKEYLQELEAKIRSVEQAGVEASSEIQTAARKVLDENRKLRTLLHERGVAESEVVAALGGPSNISYEQTSAASSLNAMLERRFTSNTLSSTSSPTLSLMRAESMPRHMPSVPPISTPAPRPTASNFCDSPSPSSIVSSMESPPPASYSTPFYTTAMTSPVPEIKTEDVPYGYSYDQTYNSSWHYTNEYNLMPQPTNYYNNTSCIDTANIIRTMRSDARPDLDAGLGCRIPNQDYYTGNAAFNFVPPHTAT